MKPSLQLNIGQHLTLTPQLQQAIRLLQLSSIELQQEIQESLDANPMLESVDEQPTDNQNESAQPDTSAQDNHAAEQSVDLNQADKLPKELPVDTAWEDAMQTYSNHGSAQMPNNDTPWQERQAEGVNLQDHLIWQAEMASFSVTDTEIAEALIDAINEQGFLSCSLDDIHQSLNQQPDHHIELDEIEAVLATIQRFEPAGIGARNLQECLLLQLNQLPDDTPHLALACQLLTHHVALLAKRDYTALSRKLKINQETLRDVLQLIQGLNPRPGGLINSAEAQYITPDVIVSKKNGRWVVELNDESLPRLRINQGYSSLVQRANNTADNTFMRNQLQEARWLLKSIQSRNETLLKVATCIFEHQSAFLEAGEAAMKPLILHQVADAIGMHESTISRVTTQKYVTTPRGVFELKYFFSSHVGTKDGGECAATAIHALIKQLVQEEDPSKPLSDSKIARCLEDKGINVARRTIAKYREALNIPPSSQRKSLV